MAFFLSLQRRTLVALERRIKCRPDDPARLRLLLSDFSSLPHLNVITFNSTDYRSCWNITIEV